MKLLLYCTKGKELWGDGTGQTWNSIAKDEDLDLVFELNPTLTRLNGKIVAQCDCEKVDNIIYNGWWNCYANSEEINYDTLFDETNTCLTPEQISKYLKNDIGYALHLSDLEVFNNPKDLSDFGVRKAPQNMMKCFDDKGNEYILISICPEHLKNILNGEKTIEIRKKILKHMEELMK